MIKKTVSILSAIFLLYGSLGLHAQQNEGGTAVSITTFSLQNANDRQMVSLDTFKGKKAVVIIFTSANCAYSNNYIDRLNKLSEKYDSQAVSFLAINSNDPSISQEDAFEEMAKQKPYVFPYLKDKDQAVAHLFKAEKTPEVFVLKAANGKFEVSWQGQIDNLPLNIKNVRVTRTNYLSNALDQILAGTNITSKSPKAGGCNIKWKRN